MISDTERREAAENLRNLTIGRSIQYKEQFFDELAEVVVGFEDYHDFDVVLEKLADLIEPRHETTEDISDNYGKFECGKCGCRIDDVTAVDNGGINFCPDCGREVIEDE